MSIDLTICHEPNKSQSDFKEKELSKIGNGNIVFAENQSEEQVFVSMATFIKGFPNFSSIDVKDIAKNIKFFRRDGKSKLFSPHIKGPGFKYDGMGIKDLKPSKDSKKIYIFVKGHKKTPQSFLDVLNSREGSSESDFDDDRSVFASNSMKKTTKPSIIPSVTSSTRSQSINLLRISDSDSEEDNLPLKRPRINVSFDL